jgi:hypothetical protein
MTHWSGPLMQETPTALGLLPRLWGLSSLKPIGKSMQNLSAMAATFVSSTPRKPLAIRRSALIGDRHGLNLDEEIRMGQPPDLDGGAGR